jgi:hypothetical protein
MDTELKLRIGQIINFDYDSPNRYLRENRGRKNENFEIVTICEVFR